MAKFAGNSPAVGPEVYSACPARIPPVPATSCASTTGYQAPALDGGRINVDSDDWICNLILRIRDPIADYLEKHGLPKNSQCSFALLVTSLVQRTYNAFLTILTMLFNLLPLFDGFVYLIRFVLDKLIEICYTRDRSEKILKILLFLGELGILSFIVLLIAAVILMPVFSLLGYVFHRVFGFVVP